MVGMGMTEGEPDIKKVLQVHKDWRVMIAGNDIAPIFPIIEDAKSKLGKGGVNVGKCGFRGKVIAIPKRSRSGFRN
jgi:hypothetical protein